MTGFGPTLAMWAAMTAVMMAPVVIPWIRHMARTGSSALHLPVFLGGYLASWLGFSTVAAALQTNLARMALFVPLASSGPRWAGTACLMVGLYQMSPLKEACLDHCRSPAGFFLSRWRGGSIGALRMGIEHGIFCLGCCWGLMIMGLVVGAMHLGWMLVLTAVMLGEIFHPRGKQLARLVGWIMLVAGVMLWSWTWL